jgi:hypothetical protein
LATDYVIATSGTADSLFPTSSSGGNTVTVNSGVINGYVLGGVANVGNHETVSGNRVFFNGGTATRVYGAATRGDGLITDNQVFINGGEVTDTVWGGHGVLNSAQGDATNNSVTISGGKIGGSVYGGFTHLGYNAKGNSVTILGGQFDSTKDVIGGRGEVNATFNSVTISGGAKIGTLYGGFVGSGDAFTGNALNLKTAGLTVEGLQDFEYLNFYLPSTLGAGDTMLTVTYEARLTENYDGSGRSSVVNLILEGSRPPLRPGDQIVLINATTLTANSGLNDTAVGQGTQGAVLIYDFDIQADIANNRLLAIVSRIEPDERVRVLAMGFLAGLALVNQGAEMTAGPGLAEALKAARLASQATGYGLGIFGSLSGGRSRYDTGSHLDMSSLSLMTGLAWGADLAPGFLTLGAFFEYGQGSYDTYDSLVDYASVHGDGDARHVGGGVAGRLDFSEVGPGHIYTEASFRAGKTRNEYDAKDLRDPLGRQADYDSSSAYYGLHLGAGYVWNITEGVSLNLYGKYFWTRLEGDSVTLKTGDPVRFKDVESSRLRLGARFAYTFNEHVSPYVGLAWEREFDGEARATTHGLAIDAPSLKGNTGIGELGLTIQPSTSLLLYFDLGVSGYTGRREGGMGSFMARLEF